MVDERATSGLMIYTVWEQMLKNLPRDGAMVNSDLCGAVWF